MASRQINKEPEVRVWDLFVRLFHWLLVAGFAVGFISGEFNVMTLHIYVGYALSLLLIARIVWGFAGSRYARFSSFIYPINITLAYLKGMQAAGGPPHYLGHNPAGAPMVFALIGLCICLCLTGLVTLAIIDFEGPFLFINSWFDDAMAYAVQNFHELLPKITLGFIACHVAGVVISSRMHKENLVKAMITGNKPVHPPNDIST